jgi:predicted Ser/Thr protein kinase
MGFDDKPASGTVAPDGLTKALHRAFEETPEEKIPERLGMYRVTRLLGKGGMGAVYEGFDDSLNRKVALKVLSPELASQKEFVERFLTEARAVAQLSNANIVQIFYAGSDGDTHFYAMEYVEGRSLQDEVDAAGPLSQTEAAECIMQSARGLAAAAEKGIIHRDIKPGNLMRAKDGTVKVADFGLAKHLGGEQRLTQTGAIMGSPYYMSPEQAVGQDLDSRTDMYSLGCTLYFLLTGRPPFMGATMMDTIMKHATEPPPEPPDMPEPLLGLLARMMAKKPEQRHGNYEALLDDVDRLVRLGLLSGIRPRGKGAEGAEQAARSMNPIEARAARRRNTPDATQVMSEDTRRPISAVWIIIAIALVLLGLMAIFRPHWLGLGGSSTGGDRKNGQASAGGDAQYKFSFTDSDQPFWQDTPLPLGESGVDWTGPALEEWTAEYCESKVPMVEQTLTALAEYTDWFMRTHNGQGYFRDIFIPQSDTGDRLASLDEARKGADYKLYRFRFVCRNRTTWTFIEDPHPKAPGLPSYFTATQGTGRFKTVMGSPPDLPKGYR